MGESPHRNGSAVADREWIGLSNVDKELIEFTFDERGDVEAVMRELVRARAGWVNIEPFISAEDLDAHRRGNRLVRLFSGKGPRIPFGTFVPASESSPASIGLQHSAGPKVLEVLAAHEVAPDPAWAVRDQSATRGLVLEARPDESVDKILDFILRAGTVVADVPVRGIWSALVHRPG